MDEFTRGIVTTMLASLRGHHSNDGHLNYDHNPIYIAGSDFWVELQCKREILLFDAKTGLTYREGELAKLGIDSVPDFISWLEKAGWKRPKGY